MYFTITFDTFKMNGVLQLEETLFSGPGLLESAYLREEDFIRLDFTKQLFPITKSFCISTLHWKGTRYKDRGKVEVKNCFIQDFPLTAVMKSPPDFGLHVSLKGHLDNEHTKNLVYQSCIIDSNGNQLNFRK